MKKNLFTVLIAAMAALLFGFTTTIADAEDAVVNMPANACMKLKVACDEKVASCEKENAALLKYIEGNCPPMEPDPDHPGVYRPKKPVPPPAGTSTAKPMPLPKPSASASTEPVKPPPVKAWTCKGFSHTPDTATTALGCSCTDDRYAVVLGVADHVAWCVLSSKLPDVKTAVDWIAELMFDPTLADPAHKAERDAKIIAVRDKLTKIELIAEGLGNEDLKGILKNLRDRLAAVELEIAKHKAAIEKLCGIENLDDPKWTPEAIKTQCPGPQKGDAAPAKGKSVSLHFPLTVNMATGPQGIQIYMLTGVMLEGRASDAIRIISGLDIGGTFVSPKTGGQGIIWPYAGLRFWLTESDLRNAISLDLKFGFRQNVSSVYPHNPTIRGRMYENSQFWGWYGTGGLDLGIRASSWLGVKIGGWIGYGDLLTTVPSENSWNHRTLPQGKGFGGGGSLGFEFSF